MNDAKKREITARGLPSPEDRPKADVVLYDGECPRCTALARLLHRLDVGGRLAFLSLHDPRTRQRFAQLSFDELMEELHVVAPSGKAFQGAAAVRHLARRVPALWPLVPALYLPGSKPAWQWLYRRLADARDTGACEVCASK